MGAVALALPINPVFSLGVRVQVNPVHLVKYVRKNGKHKSPSQQKYTSQREHRRINDRVTEFRNSLTKLKHRVHRPDRIRLEELALYGYYIDSAGNQFFNHEMDLIQAADKVGITDAYTLAGIEGKITAWIRGKIIRDETKKKGEEVAPPTWRGIFFDPGEVIRDPNWRAHVLPFIADKKNAEDHPFSRYNQGFRSKNHRRPRKQ